MPQRGSCSNRSCKQAAVDRTVFVIALGIEHADPEVAVGADAQRAPQTVLVAHRDRPGDAFIGDLGLINGAVAIGVPQGLRRGAAGTIHDTVAVTVDETFGKNLQQDGLAVVKPTIQNIGVACDINRSPRWRRASVGVVEMVDVPRLTGRPEPGSVPREFDIGNGVELGYRVLTCVGDPHHRESGADDIEL